MLAAGVIAGDAYVDALAKSVAQEQRITDAERRKIRNLFASSPWLSGLGRLHIYPSTSHGLTVTRLLAVCGIPRESPSTSAGVRPPLVHLVARGLSHRSVPEGISVRALGGALSETEWLPGRPKERARSYSTL